MSGKLGFCPYVPPVEAGTDIANLSLENCSIPLLILRLIAIRGRKRLMRKLIIGALVTVAILMAAAAAVGQEPKPVTVTTTTQVTKTIQNPDGTYTIIEYPVGKEVGIVLNPIALKEAKGTATILRDPTGTTVKLNLIGIPAEMTAVNIYAVDANGTTTLLGPVTIANGAGTLSATTPLDKF